MVDAGRRRSQTPESVRTGSLVGARLFDSLVITAPVAAFAGAGRARPNSVSAFDSFHVTIVHRLPADERHRVQSRPAARARRGAQRPGARSG